MCHKAAFERTEWQEGSNLVNGERRDNVKNLEMCAEGKVT